MSVSYVYSMWDYAAAIYEVGKAQRGAWRAVLSDTCTFGAVHVDPSRFAVRFGSAAGDWARSRVAFGPITTGTLAVAGTIDLAQPLIGQYQGVVEVHVTPTMTAFQVAIPGDIVVGGYPPTTLEVIARDPEMATHHSQMVANGSELIFLRQGSPISNSAILARQAGGTIATLYQNPTAWFGHVKGDSARIVWQELSDNGSGGSKNELYTAAWTTDPAQFSASKVGDLPGGDFVRSAYGEGWFVYFHDDATLRAIRISDGKYLDAPAPKDFGWVEPRGVVNGEIFATIHIGPPGVGAAYSIARVPIASLGTPKG